MEPVILFREDRDNVRELNAAHQFFTVHKIRSTIPNDKLVIGRYSVLPYYKELVEDLDVSGSELINTYTQHRYIADIAQPGAGSMGDRLLLPHLRAQLGVSLRGSAKGRMRRTCSSTSTSHSSRMKTSSTRTSSKS